MSFYCLYVPNLGKNPFKLKIENFHILCFSIFYTQNKLVRLYKKPSGKPFINICKKRCLLFYELRRIPDSSWVWQLQANNIHLHNVPGRKEMSGKKRSKVKGYAHSSLYQLTNQLTNSKKVLPHKVNPRSPLHLHLQIKLFYRLL